MPVNHSKSTRPLDHRLLFIASLLINQRRCNKPFPRIMNVVPK